MTNDIEEVKRLAGLCFDAEQKRFNFSMMNTANLTYAEKRQLYVDNYAAMAESIAAKELMVQAVGGYRFPDDTAPQSCQSDHQLYSDIKATK